MKEANKSADHAGTVFCTGKKERAALTITRKQDGDTLSVAVDGRLDAVSSPDLEAELKESLPGVKKLIVDFRNLEYISSSGLRALLAASKVMYGKGSMTIINASDAVKEIFTVTGFDLILEVE